MTLVELAGAAAQELDAVDAEFSFVVLCFAGEGRAYELRHFPGEDVPELLRDLADQIEGGTRPFGCRARFGEGRPR